MFHDHRTMIPMRAMYHILVPVRPLVGMRLCVPFRVYRIEDPKSAADRVRRARNSSSSSSSISSSSSSSSCGTSHNSSSMRLSSSKSISIRNISRRSSH